MDETINMFMNWNGTTKKVTIREKEPNRKSAAMEKTQANKMAPEGTDRLSEKCASALKTGASRVEAACGWNSEAAA